MAYQINYGAPQPKEYKRGLRKTRVKLVAVGVLFLLVLGIRLVFPGTGKKLREFLLPGMTGETVAAFQVMVEDVRTGTSFEDAVTAFCREIIANAKLPEN